MALEPINYMAYQQQSETGLSDIADAFKLGSMIKQNRLATQELEQQRLLKEQAANDLSQFMSLKNPTVEDYSNFITKYPSYAEAMKARYEMLGDAEKENTWKIAGQLNSAVQSGNMNVAMSIIDNEIEAYKNSGDIEGQKSMENIKTMFQSNPDAPLKVVNSMLATADKERFAQNYKAINEQQIAMEKQPFEIANLRAEFKTKIADAGLKDAQTAKAWAEYKQAPIEQAIKLEELGLKKQEKQIRLLEIQSKNTEDALKKEELKLKIEEKKADIEKKQKDLAQANQDLLSDANSAVLTGENIVNTINEIKLNPALERGTGFTSLANFIPGTEGRDFQVKVDTLKSQIFMNEIQKMRGLGALSENEGKKVADAISSLDTGMSTNEFKKSLKTIEDVINKGKESIKLKYGKALENLPSNQTTQTQDVNVEDLLKKYGAK